MKKVVIATNNPGKIKEIKVILKDYEILTIKNINCKIEVKENQDTFEGNAMKKAKEIAEALKMPAIADDSGLCIDILKGWPGVHTARFLGENATQEQRNNAILEKMKEKPERTARVRCCMAYYEEGNFILGKGEVEGKIAIQKRGKNGFGFDEIIELPNGKTFAELTLDEKNQISHRKLALQDLKENLQKFGK